MKGPIPTNSTSIENAGAKIANALRDTFDLDAGAVVGVFMPVHWQRAAWCAGVWTAGCVIALDADPRSVDLTVAGPLEADALARGGNTDVAVVSLHPFGLPLTDALPPGAQDVTLAVRQQPDAYLFDRPSGGRLLADDTLGSIDGWLAVLAIPLAVEASVVLATGAYDLDTLREQEHVTARASSG